MQTKQRNKDIDPNHIEGADVVAYGLLTTFFALAIPVTPFWLFATGSSISMGLLFALGLHMSRLRVRENAEFYALGVKDRAEGFAVQYPDDKDYMAGYLGEG